MNISSPEETEEIITKANAEPWSTKKKLTVAAILLAVIPPVVNFAYETGHDEGMEDARIQHEFRTALKEYSADLGTLKSSAVGRRPVSYTEYRMDVSGSHQRLLQLDPSDLDEDLLGTRWILEDYREALEKHEEAMSLINSMREHAGEGGDERELEKIQKRYYELRFGGS